MEAQFHRRDLPETPTSPTFAPKHAYERRSEYEELEARDWEEARTVLFPVRLSFNFVPLQFADEAWEARFR